MASRYMQQFYYSFVKNLTGIHGSVAIASGTVGVSSSSITGATVARTGVGEITITLSDKWNALVGANMTILAATAQDLVPQIKSQTIGSTNIVVVNLLAAAVPTDPTSAITLYIDLKIRNSSTNP